MKTTIEISDALLRAARRLAAERGTTLRAIVETALRRYREAASDPAAARPRLRRHSFRGRGLQPGLSETDWAAIRERAYEGRRVIAIDAHILIYAHREDSTWHEAADRCLGSAAESGAPWAIPWPCIPSSWRS